MGFWRSDESKRLAHERRIADRAHKTNRSMSRATWVAATAGVAAVAVAIVFGVVSLRSDDGDSGGQRTGSRTTAPSKLEAECRFEADPAAVADPPVRDYKVAESQEILDTGFVNLHSGPCVDGQSINGQLDPGTRLSILCQARGSNVYDTSTVWDLLENGKWIADYFVEGTLVNQFTPGIPLCREK